MGKKRKRSDALGGGDGQNDSVQQASKTENIRPKPAPLNVTPTQSHGQSNGNIPSASKQENGLEDAQKEAREWLAAEAAHLDQLRQDPRLASACTSLVGTEPVKIAKSFGQELSLRRSAFDIMDKTVPNLPQTPAVDSTAGAQSQDYPALPEIRDPALAKKAFTHRSVLTDAQVAAGGMGDYERLEWIGDSYLYVFATRLIWKHFSLAEVGKLAHIRETLINNVLLAKFSLHYGFDKKIKCRIKHANLVDPKNPTSVKLMGDVFEAYLGAVVQSRPADGFQVAEKLMHALWTPLLPTDKSSETKRTGKLVLAQRVLGVNIKLNYQPLKPPQPAGPGRETFTMGVYLTGWGRENVLLGQGEGGSKNEAGWTAADNALLNPVTEEIATHKRKFDGLVKAEQEREGGPRQEVLDALNKQFKGTG